MRFLLFLVTLLLAIGAVSGEAAEVGVSRRQAATPATVYRVVPRSPAAQLVWAADACWRGCAQDCGRQFQACLSADLPESCVARNDACDRFCQGACRIYGGPLLPLD
ncbi:MAG TPA: hypothetical protein VFF88_10240 [Methylocella sp.]|nr:hypothetical protein [Methylocella sp.]